MISEYRRVERGSADGRSALVADRTSALSCSHRRARGRVLCVLRNMLLLALSITGLSLGLTPAFCQSPAFTTRTPRVNPPAWYAAPPVIHDTVIARGQGRSNDHQVAVDKAVLEARSALADSIDHAWEGLLWDIEEQTGHGHVSMHEPVTLQGSTVRVQKITKRGRTWTAFVLVGLPEESVRSELLRRLNRDRAWYEKIKDAPAVREIETPHP